MDVSTEGPETPKLSTEENTSESKSSIEGSLVNRDRSLPGNVPQSKKTRSLSCARRVVVVTVVLSILSSPALGITIILHYQYIIKKCNATANGSATFVDISYFVIYLIPFASCAFLHRVRKAHKQLATCKWPEKLSKKCCFGLLVFFTHLFTTGTAIAISVMSALRDKEYLDGTCKNKYTEALYIIYAILKGVTHTSQSLTSICTMVIIYTSEKEWKTDSFDTTANDNAEDKFYKLNKSYKEKGHQVVKRCNYILKEWFAIVCLNYFILILITLVQVIKTIKENNDDEDTNQDRFEISHSALLLAHYFFAFSGPYIMATRLNALHHEYYLEMQRSYRTYKVSIKLEQEDKQANNHIDCITFLYRLGEDIEPTQKVKKPAEEQANQQSCFSTCCCYPQTGKGEKTGLLSSAQQQQSSMEIEQSPDAVLYIPDSRLAKYKQMAKEKYEKSYKNYYLKISERKIAKVDEFDFTPTILYTNVPLGNQGYVFAIMLTVVSVAFSII